MCLSHDRTELIRVVSAARARALIATAAARAAGPVGPFLQPVARLDQPAEAVQPATGALEDGRLAADGQRGGVSDVNGACEVAGPDRSAPETRPARP